MSLMEEMKKMEDSTEPPATVFLRDKEHSVILTVKNSHPNFRDIPDKPVSTDESIESFPKIEIEKYYKKRLD